MTTTVMPTRPASVNLVGLTKTDYKGAPSTLCNGCGHDSIASQIIAVAYDLSLEPHRIAKFSGIGCSSKSPAYFLGRSHSINGLHGRHDMRFDFTQAGRIKQFFAGADLFDNHADVIAVVRIVPMWRIGRRFAFQRVGKNTNIIDSWNGKAVAITGH